METIKISRPRFTLYSVRLTLAESLIYIFSHLRRVTLHFGLAASTQTHDKSFISRILQLMENGESTSSDRAKESAPELENAPTAGNPAVPGNIQPEVALTGVETNTVYLTGFKLYTIVAALTMVAFLIMLNSSILVTVSKSGSTWSCTST